MKRLSIIILLAALFAVSCGSSRRLAKSDSPAINWGWREICPGVEAGNASVSLFGSNQNISVVRYRLSMYDTCIANDTGADADSTSALVERHGGIAGINASYFDMKALTPVTFVKENGICEGRTSEGEFGLRTDGLLHIRRGHRIGIEKCARIDCDTDCEDSDDAIASGPVLLKNGQPLVESWPDNTFYAKRHPRTLFGTSGDRWGYMIVIDGRSVHAAGATIPEAVEIALMLGLDEAINLDGGGSSTIWVKGEGVLNHPSDNRRFDHFGQRVVPNILYIR